MPAARLPPGLYERLLSLALERDIQALDPKRFTAKTEAPEEAERARLLARYVHHLLSLALDAQKGDNAEARQLDLCRRVLDQLTSTAAAPCASSPPPTSAALLEGLEWNVRLSQAETPALLDKFRATFETYWEDGQFEDYDPARDAKRFDDSPLTRMRTSADSGRGDMELGVRRGAGGTPPAGVHGGRSLRAPLAR